MRDLWTRFPEARKIGAIWGRLSVRTRSCWGKETLVATLSNTLIPTLVSQPHIPNKLRPSDFTGDTEAREPSSLLVGCKVVSNSSFLLFGSPSLTLERAKIGRGQTEGARRPRLGARPTLGQLLPFSHTHL